MPEAADAFRDFLRKNALQLTAQRQLIADEFSRIKNHVSVEELYAALKKRDPSIGQVTVFRTLKLLVDAKIARPVALGHKTIRYEYNYRTGHHDHLICNVCGAVIEVFDEELEKLQEKLCEKYSFQPSHHQLEIFGTCLKCSG